MRFLKSAAVNWVCRRLRWIGRAFGKAGNASFQAIRRGASPSYDRLEALGKVLGLEFYFGPVRVLEPSVVAANAIMDEARMVEAEAVQEAINATREYKAAMKIGQGEIEPLEFAAIPRYEAQLAAGTGVINHNESPIEHLAFFSCLANPPGCNGRKRLPSCGPWYQYGADTIRW